MLFFLFIILTTTIIATAYTGYRRSIDDILETAATKSNSNESPQSRIVDIDVDNHNQKTSTATIITQNTSALSSSSTSSNDQQTNVNHQQHQNPSAMSGSNTMSNTSDNFLRNEIKQSQSQSQPPQPAPRTRLSSQNSVPMTNGDNKTLNQTTDKADDASQVRLYFNLLFILLSLNSDLKQKAFCLVL